VGLDGEGGLAGPGGVVGVKDRAGTERGRGMSVYNFAFRGGMPTGNLLSG